MQELTTVITNVGLIHWLLLVMGLTLHLLTRITFKKVKQKSDFDWRVFAEDYIKPAIFATVSSVACIVALEQGNFLQGSSSGFVALGTGYMNASFFRMMMDAFKKKMDPASQEEPNDNFPGATNL